MPIIRGKYRGSMKAFCRCGRPWWCEKVIISGVGLTTNAIISQYIYIVQLFLCVFYLPTFVA